LDIMSKRILTLVVALIIAFSTMQPMKFIVASGQSISVVDALGRTINLTQVPSRVISLSPSITEILLSLNLSNVLVGVDHYSYTDWYLNASQEFASRNITDVGGYWWSAINIEKILSLQPDLVLADAGAHKPLLNTLVEYNLTVVYLKGGSATSIEDVYSDIFLVGKIFNMTSEALALIDKIERHLEEGRNLLRGYSGVSVLYVVGIYQGVWVAGKTTFFDDLISRLGLRNAAGAYGWAPVGIEEIASWKPDVILVAGMGVTETDVENAGLTKLGARVVLLNSTETDVLSRPSPIIMLAPNIIYDVLKGLPATTPPGTTSATTTLTTTATETQTVTTTYTTTLVRQEFSTSEVLLYTTISAALALLTGLLAGRFISKRS